MSGLHARATKDIFQEKAKPSTTPTKSPFPASNTVAIASVETPFKV